MCDTLSESTGLWAVGDSEERDYGAVEPDDVRVVEFAYALAEFCSSHSGDLVDHQSTRRAETSSRRGLDGQTKQGRISGVCRERTERDGVGVESVVLQNDRRPWFAGVVGTAVHGPDFSTSHSSGHSETASIKS